MTRPAPPTLPDTVKAEQAVASIRGYAFQLYLTADAWMTLGPEDVLLIEVADDFAVMTRAALQMVQAKDDPSRNTTLRSDGVVKAINRFWALRTANPGRAVTAVYQTTSGAGRERGFAFPDDTPGLLYWSAVASGADAAPLRAALAALPLDTALAEWLGSVDDARLRDDLVRPVRWLTETEPIEGRRNWLAGRIRTQRPGVTVAEAFRVVDHLLLLLLESAAGVATQERTALDRDAEIERATLVQLHAEQLRALHRPADFHPPLHLRQRDSSGGRLFFFAAEDRVPWQGRTEEFAALQGWLDDPATFSWTLLTGPGGSGKSRMAFETCLRAQDRGWRAGFLSVASAYSHPENFVRYRPDRPSLLVLDYVMAHAVEAGEVVRTLIERTIAGDLAHPVRILLLERSDGTAGWFIRFRGAHSSLIDGYGAELARPGFITLPPLSSTDLDAILEHVAGPARLQDRARTISALAELDPHGRPLFAALAGEALQNGRDLRQLSRTGLVQDVLSRERQRWASIASDTISLHRHQNAVVLATMVGGLRLPDQTGDLDKDRFPFSAERFDPALMNAIDGGDQSDIVQAMEPDIVGGLFVLDTLQPSHVFDETGADILRAAAALGEDDLAAATAHAAFAIRLYEDFPEEAAKAGFFFDPPRPITYNGGLAWLYGASRLIAVIAKHAPPASQQMLGVVREVQQALSEWLGPTVLAGEAIAAFADAVGFENPLTARDLFEELNALAIANQDEPDLGRIASWLGLTLGEQALVMDDFKAAERIFQRLRSLAHEFAGIGDEPEEIAEDAASLGLTIRQYHARAENWAAVDALDRLLWLRPSRGVTIDLAERTGQVLMQRSDDPSFGSSRGAFEELRARSLARTDIQELAFWAANTGFDLVRTAQVARDDRGFIDALRDLTDWIRERIDYPDMTDVFWHMVAQHWIDENFNWSERPALVLQRLWAEAQADASAGPTPRAEANLVMSLKAELLTVLDLNREAAWSKRIRLEVMNGDGG